MDRNDDSPTRGQKVWRRIGVFRPLIPLIMLGIGWLIPAMRTPVGVPESNALWIPVFVFFAITVIWLIAEIKTVTDRNTSVAHLQWDDFASLGIALILTYYARGNWEWWYVFPWVGAIADACFSGWLAINNAAQKPLIQEGRG